MHERTRTLLVAADHPTAWEYPPGFDYTSAMLRARALASSLEALLGEPVHVDDQIQDASFFVELSLVGRNAQPERGVLANARMVIRLSTFGNLCITYSVCSPSAELPAEVWERVKTLLADAGYVHVEESELEEPYDGAHAGLRKEHATWWVRFFDYL